MIFQIDGASTGNKGAQLMIFAIIDAVLKKFPDAHILINNQDVDLSIFKKENLVQVDKVPHSLGQKLVRMTHTHRIIKLLFPKKSVSLTKYKASPDVDMILDAGGFQFGDTWKHNQYDLLKWNEYLNNSKKNGTVTVFLPQAFGPFQKDISKKMGKTIIDGASIVYARDTISYDYLKELTANPKNICLSTDFTALVNGVQTSQSKECQGKVCMIPNSKMISEGIVGEEQFVDAFSNIINFIFNKGYEVFLLNHEGENDLRLCNKIAERMANRSVSVYSGLDALETKGVIASSYLVVSSRFHGVANSLNSCVPCLATSWSHKYQMLMEDYDQFDNILDLNDMTVTYSKIESLLGKDTNAKTRRVLTEKKKEICNTIEKMWDNIWGLLS